ncbi:glutamine--fructose-6-phosphate transaminase (isomerizing) [Candidatus Curtissbacteria bacterium]|nr:glutamine--fructose-6-phosphate transaminase (isomerizing) [Candidatus Curtissbacteria bacterium]
MCGIFGYVGKQRDAAKIVFEGLKRLEYRGYDSWGIVAVSGKLKVESGKLLVEKHVGKIGNSTLNSQLSILKSSIALGHTRWATHGGVTKENAHPHLDCSGNLALVHNGIVENYQELKKSLKKKHKFKSQTDSEVIVHMIEELRGLISSKVEPSTKVQPLKDTVRKVFLKLTGLNAIVVMNDGELVVAKNGSPLVLGIGSGEYLVASDAAALLPHTNKVIFLRDNQMAEITDSGVNIFDIASDEAVTPKVEILNWKIEEANLGGHKHFMIKEIYEQPKVIRNISETYIDQISDLCKVIEKAHGTFFIGAGTAFNACLAGAYLFSKIAKAHVNTIVASEFNYLEHFLHKETLVIALSQSGETIDVIEPLKRAKEKGAKIVAIVNNLGSTIWQMADYKLLLGAGVEMAVASTKAYVSKLSVLILIAYGLVNRLDEGRKLLAEAADEVERLLFEEVENIKKIAKILAVHDHIFTIGRGLSYQTALEAALKMKEVSYIHTEGLAGGELKHGPIALISKGTPCVVFAPNDETHEAIISNATEIKARGGLIIGVGSKKSEVFDEWVQVRDLGDASIICNVIPAQLFGYFLAIEKGLDPDKPRNLAKSVTVK